MAVSCETEAGDGSIVSGALCVSDFDGDSLIFGLENVYVHHLSFLLSKTPPSFATVFCVPDVSRASPLYGFSVR